MGEEAKGGAPKKLSTKDILAAARAAAGKPADTPPAEQAAAPPEPTVETPTEQTPALAATGEAAPIAPKPAAKPAAIPPAAGKPSSTSGILAAARAAAAAKAGGGEAQPAPAPKAAPAAKPAAAGGAKPKSTADILAAARAAKAGGTPPTAEPAAPKEKPAAAAKVAAKASPKAPVAAAATGPQLSVEEMLAAVRPGGAKGTATAAAHVSPKDSPVLPPAPQKPMPGKKPAVAVEEQRSFLFGMLFGLVATPFAAAWTMFTAASAAMTLGTARFMLPNVLTEPPRKFKIGPPSDYDLGTVSTKWVAQYGIWVVHTDQYKGKNSIYALISVCTHLGCTPSWLEGEQKFKCPCHGSGFYITGVNFEGPAPRPLERAGIRVAEDKMLEVDKSVKFQEEMGQWETAASYVPMS